jgi:hypothetical protein
MWLWIKRWRDWAMMRDLWPVHRVGPQPQALHYSYEKAGLTLHDQPIPWNAEAVLVEATLRLPTAASRRKPDFQLRLPYRALQPADSLRRLDRDDLYRLAFRVTPPPATTVNADLLWRNGVRGQLTLPHLSRDDFVENVRLQLPTTFARLGTESVACQTYVASQCKGLLASAILTSPTSLVPLLDMDLHVEFRNERGGPAQLITPRLSSSQLAGRQALVVVAPRRFPRKIGSWIVTWTLGDAVLATHRIRAISQKHFHRSLRVVDTRFVVQREKDMVSVARQYPSLDGVQRIGPCFLVCSKEPGMAGLTRFRVRAQAPGAAQPPLMEEQEVLITDGPTMVAPGTVEAAAMVHVGSFELYQKGQMLGSLSLCPAPEANFTNEGGFKPTEEYTWTAAAEEELNDRLTKLLEAQPKED